MARLIAFLIFGGFGLFMLYVGAVQFVQQRQNLASAEPIDAVVTKSEVFTSTSSDTDTRTLRSNSTTTYRPDVTFVYVVSGQSYESERLYPSEIGRGYASHTDAEEVLRPYPVGASIRAFVDRAHPERAFLIAERGNGPVVFIAIGLLLPPLAWILGKYI